MSLVNDVFKGVVKVSWWLPVPIGLLLMLCALYGINEGIDFHFPASVALMLALFISLCLASLKWKHKVSQIVKIINIPAGFALRWINIFFTPAFIPLPLSSWISAREALTIAAIFIVGFVLAMVGMAYATVLMQRLFKKTRRSTVERAEELESSKESNLGASTSSYKNEQNIENTSKLEESNESSPTHSRSNSIGGLLSPVDTLRQVPQNVLDDIARGDEDELELQYRRSITLSRQATQRREFEVAATMDDIISNSHSDPSTDGGIPSPPSPVAKPLSKGSVNIFIETKNKLFCRRASLAQTQQIERHLKIAYFIQNNFDYMVFTTLFIVSLPIYFTLDYAMPLHLSISIFTFLFMINVPPPKWRKYLHPVLCSVGISWLLYYIFSLMKHEDFLDSLRQYKTGRNYLRLFNHRQTNKPPGAGDVFSTLMDCSIVSLSISMFNYRDDLIRHFSQIVPVIIFMTVTNFFIYPIVCYKLGLSPENSLGFAGRSVTLALGTPFEDSLGGSQQLMACTTVVTGILGALFGQKMFKWMKIREDDYVTRGITLGLNCSAIATAHLLSIDPRAGAMSSLAFTLFGTLMVIFAAIPPLASVIRSWVGLE
ncbi:Plastidal glycolate/glycerate translocator 1, chloroplastic [Cyberlindnera fabianii]|uniref:Plastidal glycolate/glycerate translocator 1, chloroplastic n=1 Tax=Cyberlindnera fabianii TaxID=36022 RepID=A0A1V2LCI1_CYBFA|nr:Plastidal glycolate/glycerate translocator 1, chloroplastic [Cyberlindnera fabianii]